MNSARDPALWNQPAGRTPQRPPSAEDLLAPRTQIVADRDAYLGQGRNDVGRRISDDQVELFISADVAGALQHEFTQHAPEFVVLHDVGTSAGLRLLTGLASAAASKVQRLSIRRQGHGVALAVLQFVEMPLADGTLVRVYSTDINADSQARAQVARVLLGFSRLGVLLVGELPPHALTAQLTPLHDALLRGPWPNRDLLMVPLGSGTALAAQAQQLGGHSPVAVHVTPQATQPKQAWTFIGGAWNRLHGQPGGERALSTDMARAVPQRRVPTSEAATEPMPLNALPNAHPVPPSARRRAEAAAPTQPMPLTPMPVAGVTRWQAYAERCALIKGTLACCVFDAHSAQPLAHIGSTPAPDRLAQQGAALLNALQEGSRALGLGGAPGEASFSTAQHHLLLRPVAGHPGVAVHLVLLASAGNLTLARMQLERIEPPR